MTNNKRHYKDLLLLPVMLKCYESPLRFH